MATPAQKKLVKKRLADIRLANNTQSKRVKWTGFSGKTFWDWIGLLVQVIGAVAVPLSVIVGVVQFNVQQKDNLEMSVAQQQHDLQVSTDQQQQATLETYLDRMSDLLFTDKLGQSKRGDEVRGVARARTLTALQNLNQARKAILIRFLYESGLIQRARPTDKVQNPIIDLSSADLSDVNLSDVNLSDVNLSGVNLGGANLGGVNLDQANLSKADLTSADLFGALLTSADLSNALLTRADLSGALLSGADLSGAFLTSADLSDALLTRADLSGALLTRADLSGADLYHATVTTGQLATAASLSGATMPDGSIHP